MLGESEHPESTTPEPPIRKFTPWEAIRQRPGMYIGSTDELGLYQLVYEILNNSVGEIIAGHGDRVEVVIRADNAIMVRDNGPGIPVETPPGEQKPILELVMTELGAADRLKLGQDKLFLRWGGGMATVVNALSEWAQIEVRRDGQIYRQEYHTGIPTGPVALVSGAPTDWGTTTTFRPDPTIFPMTEYDYDVLAQHSRELCYLTRGLTITVRDERPGQEREVSSCFKYGIQTWVQLLNLEYLNPYYMRLRAPFYVEAVVGTSHIEVALQYNGSSIGRVLTFANNDNMTQGGTLLTGFQAGLLNAINSYARAHNMLPEDVDKLTSADIREGLTAIISIKLPNPLCNNPFWIRLDNPEVYGQVKDVVSAGLNQFFAEHPDAADIIVKGCATNAKARAARTFLRRKARHDRELQRES
jgi:DNA gyrase subunit B